jgi:RNA polymerase sigma factor (sigma-70 family)
MTEVRSEQHHLALDDRTALHRFATAADPVAFEIMTTRYQSMVLGTCVRILRSPADAEDAAQETFLKLARHAAQIQSNLGAWLHAAAMGCSIDLIRRSSAIRRSEHAAARADGVEAQSPDEAMHWSEVEPVLDAALAALEPGDRELLVARFLCTRTQRDIAHELGISEGTVSRRMDKALQRLREQLKQRGIAIFSTSAMLGVLGAIPAVPVPAKLTSSVLKIPLFQSIGTPASTSVKPSAALVIKALGVGVAVVAITGGGYMLTQRPRLVSTPPPIRSGLMMPQASIDAPDRPSGSIGPFQIVSAGERNDFSRGLWIRDKRLAVRHGIDPKSGMTISASLEILARDEDKDGVILRTRVREITPAGIVGRFTLGQQVEIRAYFDEYGRIVLNPLTDGVQLGANEPRWYGVRPPLGWEEHSRIPADAGPDGILGPWTEAERIPVTITNREIRFGTDTWQSAVYRIVEWDKRDGYARVESIHAGGRNPRLIGSRFRLIIRKDEEGYTIAYFPPTKSTQISWPSSFVYSPENPVTVVTIRDLP